MGAMTPMVIKADGAELEVSQEQDYPENLNTSGEEELNDDFVEQTPVNHEHAVVLT